MAEIYEEMERKPLKNIYTCFPGGKHKVLTMSYDDGREEDRRLLEIFHQDGIKATFNLNGMLKRENGIPREEYASLYEGHEVACHTALHPTIERCPDEQILQQVLEDRRILESLVGYPVRGMAYPNGSVNDRITRMLPYTGIRYSRTVLSTHSFAMPENYLRWNPTFHHKDPEGIRLAREFTELHKTQYMYMMYIWGHSYEFTNDDNWDVMEELCKILGARDDIWYATNIEIYDYMEAAGRMQVAVDGSFAYNPNARDIYLEVDKQPVCCKAGVITTLP